MDSVVHFEMPYDDRDRMAKFYASAFGWHTQKLYKLMPPSMTISAPTTKELAFEQR